VLILMFVCSPKFYDTGPLTWPSLASLLSLVSFKQSATQAAKQSADQGTASRTFDALIDLDSSGERAAAQPADQRTEQPTDQPADETDDQAVKRPADQTGDLAED
jgi:hypothetical protein